jgi:hypothetical protein
MRTLGALAPLQSSHLLPWSDFRRPPLVGFVGAGPEVFAKRRPVQLNGRGFRRSPRRAPLPPPPTPPPKRRVTAAERPLPQAFPPASAPERPSLQLVPSSWFRTTSTVSSARRSRACCIPLPVMGFAAFPADPHPEPDDRRTDRRWEKDIVILAARFTPLEGILAGSRTTSPWPLPPCRWPSRRPDPPASTVADEHLGAPPTRSLDFGALLRRRVRTRTRPLPIGPASRPSLGFVPLRGPSALPAGLSSHRTRRRTPRQSEDNRVRTTSSVPHPSRSVRDGPATSSRRPPGSDTARRPEGHTRRRRAPDTDRRSEERHRPGSTSPATRASA